MELNVGTYILLYFMVIVSPFFFDNIEQIIRIIYYLLIPDTFDVHARHAFSTNVNRLLLLFFFSFSFSNRRVKRQARTYTHTHTPTATRRYRFFNLFFFHVQVEKGNGRKPVTDCLILINSLG